MPTLRRTLIGTIALSAVVAAVVPVINIGIFSLTPSNPEDNKTVIVEIYKGESPLDVLKTLLETGVIKNARNFNWVGRLTRRWKKVKAGEYQLSPTMSPLEIFSVLTSGISVSYPITVREGENMYEIAKSLAQSNLTSAEKFLTLCKDRSFISSFKHFKDHQPPTLEGFLFPDTYFFNKTLSAADMIKQMVNHFFENWGPEQIKKASELHLTLLEVVTLASIIEKETGVPEERPLVSSIFHNRMRKKMRLQSDPTTIYGMWERYKGNITKRDLQDENEYNTYTISGLPVGPISNPGKESLKAALNPETSDYLYFVSHNDGTHQFSKTIEEHNQAVRKYQLNPNAKKGKSWRDRVKKSNSSS